MNPLAHATPSSGQRLLLVNPHNFMLQNSGINARTRTILAFLTRRGFTIDLLSLTHFVDTWPRSPVIKTPEIVINEIRLSDFRRRQRHVLHRFAGRLKSFISDQGGYRTPSLPDYAFKEMKHAFTDLVTRHHYDIILISYAYWAGLIEGHQQPQTRLMLEISDALTANLCELYPGRYNPKTLLDEEVRRVNLFDEVFCISLEELTFFSARTERPRYHHIPHFLPLPGQKRLPLKAEVCLVASDNPHNIRGMAWFCRHVLPRLPQDYRILVVGPITRMLKKAPRQIISLPFVEDLSTVYNACKLAICPLQSGTGQKIKVVEALAHGLPVVCTPHGIVGFEKHVNTGCLVTSNPREFADFMIRLQEDERFLAREKKRAIETFKTCFEQDLIEKRLDDLFLPGTRGV